MYRSCYILSKCKGARIPALKTLQVRKGADLIVGVNQSHPNQAGSPLKVSVCSEKRWDRYLVYSLNVFSTANHPPRTETSLCLSVYIVSSVSESKWDIDNVPYKVHLVNSALPRETGLLLEQELRNQLFQVLRRACCYHNANSLTPTGCPLWAGNVACHSSKQGSSHRPRQPCPSLPDCAP